MTEPTLRKTLEKRKLPAILIDETITAVQADRNALRPVHKKREQHIRLWKQIIDPAVAELRNVQHMQKLTLTHNTPERTAALEAYAALLELLVGKLKVNIEKIKAHADTQHRNVEDLKARQLRVSLIRDKRDIPKDTDDDDLLTPSRQASKTTRAFPNGKPNGGAHWVDYVPPSAVAQIQALFDVIPRTKGVKRKHPFPVLLDKATSAKRRAALIERTTKELSHIERRIAVELANRKLTDTHVFKHQEIDSMRLQVSKMQSAIHIMTLLPSNAFIPATWHGVMTTRTKPGISPLPKGQKQ